MKISRIIFKDRSLWFKLLFPAILPVIFVVIIVGIMLKGSFETAMLKEAESRADGRVELTRISMSHSFVIYNKGLLDNFVDGLGKMDDVRYALVVDKADNRVLAHNIHIMDGYLMSELPKTMRSVLNADKIRTPDETHTKNRFYIKSAPIIIDGKQYATLHIVFTFDEVLRKMTAFKKNILFASIIAVITGIAFALIAAKKIGTPINNLARYAELAGKGDFDYLLQYDGKDAIGRLVDSFNQMLDKIKAKQKQLTALNRISDVVYSSLDIDTVAECAVKAMMNYSKSTASGLFSSK